MAGFFYPSMVVNLKMRFDEAFSVVTLDPQSVESLTNAGIAAGQLARPLVSKDNLSQVMGIVPKVCSVELLGFRQAGRFSLQLEFKDFPLDPRVIRAVDVEIHLGAVPAEDFGTGMTSTPTPGKKRSTLIDTRTQGGTINEKTLVIAGLVDVISGEHSDSASMIYMDGRDYRGILLDTPVVGALLAQIKLGQDIKSTVEQIIRYHPLLKTQLNAQNLQVFVNLDEWGGKLPTVANDTDLIRPLKGASGNNPHMPMKGDSDKVNFWDLITQFCYLVGAVPFFIGKKLWIRRARSLYDRMNAGTPGNPTPFTNGQRRTVKTVEGTEELAVRRLVYGHDLLNFKLERKLCGTGKRPTIIAVSQDPGLKDRGFQARIIEARWPEKVQVTSVCATGEASQEEILRIPVPGIRNKDRLKEIARDIYEEIGRGEMSGAVATRSLASFGGNNQDPDLLSLRPGDAVELVTAANSAIGTRPPVVSELTAHNSRSFEEEVEALTKRLGDANLARVIVATARNSIQELQRVFRVKEVKYSWDASSGVAIEFDFQNYVEART